MGLFMFFLVLCRVLDYSFYLQIIYSHIFILPFDFQISKCGHLVHNNQKAIKKVVLHFNMNLILQLLQPSVRTVWKTSSCLVSLNSLQKQPVIRLSVISEVNIFQVFFLKAENFLVTSVCLITYSKFTAVFSSGIFSSEPGSSQCDSQLNFIG